MERVFGYDAGYIHGMIDTSPAAARRMALPRLLGRSGMLAKGIYYVTWLKAHGVLLASGIEPLELLGNAHVHALRYRDSSRHVHEIAADAAAFGFGLRSETQLADLAGCEFRFDALNRQWLPETDTQGRARGLGNLYLAGDGAGIAGAEAAELAGERAAYALLADRGLGVPAARGRRIASQLKRAADFRLGLEQAFPFPTHLARQIADDTILCRCEAVTAGTLRASLAGIDARELNRAKAFSRVGMGRCQGRFCGAAAAEVLAAALGKDVAEVGRLRAQPPVKPLPVGAL